MTKDKLDVCKYIKTCSSKKNCKNNDICESIVNLLGENAGYTLGKTPKYKDLQGVEVYDNGESMISVSHEGSIYSLSLDNLWL